MGKPIYVFVVIFFVVIILLALYLVLKPMFRHNKMLNGIVNTDAFMRKYVFRIELTKEDFYTQLKTRNINDVLEYVGKSIYVDVDKYNPGEYFYDDYIGCEVYDKGEKIGVVTDIMEVPQGEILVIKKNNGKEALVPFVDEFVIEIDVENNKIIIESIEGLL